MRRIVSNNFQMSFSRAGGSIITARVDVWRASGDQWVHVDALPFDRPVVPKERQDRQLDRGEYTCVFQCFVEESLNGKYDFDLSVDGSPTYVDQGDVNTTAAKNDSKVYKDQFILEVQ